MVRAADTRTNEPTTNCRPLWQRVLVIIVSQRCLYIELREFQILVCVYMQGGRQSYISQVADEGLVR